MIRYKQTFYKDPPAKFDGVFLWDFLDDVFSGLMDFDAVVERNGRFLVFETKDPGTPISTGQLRTLDRLVKTPRFTVVFCAKRPEDIYGWQVWTWRGKDDHLGDATALRDWCSSWWQSAGI